jgi:hypothetical protein
MNYESYKRERIDALAKELEWKKEVEGLMRHEPRISRL